MTKRHEISGAVDPSVGRRRKRARLSPLTVIGELLIVAGLAVFGYIAWQPWHTGITVVNEQAERSTEIGSQWASEAANESDSEETPAEWDGAIPVATAAGEGDIYAILHVPAFGTNFANVIAEGTNQPLILDPANRGIGHYETTQQFGEVGNTAIAAHRSGPIITPFREIMELRVGDPLFVETQDGWYTYRFRSIEYALPTEVDVLNPFPRLEGTPGDDQILTLTTCHPKWAGSDERAIAYAVLESFSPASDGIPVELQELNPELTRDGSNGVI